MVRILDLNSPLGTVTQQWQSYFLLLTSFRMCIPPAETCRAGASQATLLGICRGRVDWLWFSSAQGGERALLGSGTGEDMQDSVSLPSQVCFLPFKILFLSICTESNVFRVLDTLGLLQLKSCLVCPVLGKWNTMPERIALTGIGKDADFYFMCWLQTLF